MDFKPPQTQLAMEIFLYLVGEDPGSGYDEGDQIRSAPNSDTVDVKLGDQWYRVSSVPIDEPISMAEHNDEAPPSSAPNPDLRGQEYLAGTDAWR